MPGNFIEAYQVEDDTLCDEIVDYFHASPALHNVVGAEGDPLRAARRSTDMLLKQGQNDDLLMRYLEHIKEIAEAYMNTYPQASSNLGIVEPLQIRRYLPGEGVYADQWESSHAGARHRFLGFLTYLNDVDDGGGTQFIYQGVTMPAKKGRTLVWPCEFTHTHKDEVSNQGTKYVITGTLAWLPEEE